MRYLTKSRFKLALECITKLYYTRNPDYADESVDDSFLDALAEGGFQVGELAKFLFSDDPIGENITITAIDHEEALRETESRLSKPGRVVIAEAAFRYKSLFVRTDLLVKEDNVINLYEVKSKSTDGEDADFITKRGEPHVSSAWELSGAIIFPQVFQEYSPTCLWFIYFKPCVQKYHPVILLVSKSFVYSPLLCTSNIRFITWPGESLQ